MKKYLHIPFIFKFILLNINVEIYLLICLIRIPSFCNVKYPYSSRKIM